jgi:hypothetical protein
MAGGSAIRGSRVGAGPMPSEVNPLLDLEFHTGVQTVMKLNHPLLKMER